MTAQRKGPEDLRPGDVPCSDEIMEAGLATTEQIPAEERRDYAMRIANATGSHDLRVGSSDAKGCRGSVLGTNAPDTKESPEVRFNRLKRGIAQTMIKTLRARLIEPVKLHELRIVASLPNGYRFRVPESGSPKIKPCEKKAAGDTFLEKLLKASANEVFAWIKENCVLAGTLVSEGGYASPGSRTKVVVVDETLEWGDETRAPNHISRYLELSTYPHEERINACFVFNISAGDNPVRNTSNATIALKPQDAPTE